MRPKILSIEDATNFRSLIRLALEFDGFDVVEAVNGKHGLDMAVQQTPDLILLDLKMPEMNGLQFCKEIKRHFALQDTPIILLSSSEDADEIAQCMQAGAVDHVMKPFRPLLLLERVKKHIAQSRPSRQG